MDSQGINRLARALNERMKAHSDKPWVFDFGSIQNDMSLLTNKFPLPIPQTDYVVCRSVALGGAGSILGQTQSVGKPNSGKHIHGENGGHFHPDAGWNTHTHVDDEGEMEHVHDVLVGDNLRWLTPGDRVLVAWVGDDACVMDVIFPATRIRHDTNDS